MTSNKSRVLFNVALNYLQLLTIMTLSVNSVLGQVKTREKLVPPDQHIQYGQHLHSMPCILDALFDCKNGPSVGSSEHTFCCQSLNYMSCLESIHNKPSCNRVPFERISGNFTIDPRCSSPIYSESSFQCLFVNYVSQQLIVSTLLITFFASLFIMIVCHLRKQHTRELNFNVDQNLDTIHSFWIKPMLQYKILHNQD